MKKNLYKISFKKILIIFIILFFFFQLVNSYSIGNKNIFKPDYENHSNIIFKDNFKNSSNWNEILLPTFIKLTDFETKNGLGQLEIILASKYSYFDSEIFEDSYPYKYNDMKMRVKLDIDSTTKGSRGWGFWTGSFNISECQMAWFIHQTGSVFYPMNDLWIQCVNGDLNNMTCIPINGYDVTEWHDYEIKWNKENVVFYIDGNPVANITTGVPDISCRIDIWIDNAVWQWYYLRTKFLSDPFTIVDMYYPNFKNQFFPSTLNIDFIEVRR
jgi:hypothetical protein